MAGKYFDVPVGHRYNGTGRPFGCMPSTKITPCGHCPPRKHKARGMCNSCYDRLLRVRALDQPVVRVPLPRGDRTEMWVWDHEYWDISETTDDLSWKHDVDIWAVEFDGDAITGAYGPMKSRREWAWAVKLDRIVRNEVVIEVMERRRDEFERLERLPA